MKNIFNKKSRSSWLKKGDTVVVLCGREKKKTGAILHMKGDLVWIQKLHMQKKATKDGFVNREGPVHLSNIAPFVFGVGKVRLFPQVNNEGGKDLFYRVKGEEAVFYRKLVGNKKDD